jgi:tRNA U54 and U55 pseudouridine synthase Pus10
MQKTIKLMRHCDQEMDRKVMLYSNIDSKASQPKVCIICNDCIEKLASDFLSNVFEMFKLWQISAWLTGSFGGDTFQSRNLFTLAENEE